MSDASKVVKGGNSSNVGGGAGDKASSRSSLASETRLRGSVAGMSKNSLEAESRRRSSLGGFSTESKTMALGENAAITGGGGERDRRKRTSGVMFAADTVQHERSNTLTMQNLGRRRSTLNVQQTIEAFKDRMVRENGSPHASLHDHALFAPYVLLLCKYLPVNSLKLMEMGSLRCLYTYLLRRCD
jgi:hypothetical protein